MKKHFKSYVVLWAVLLAAFNIISFVAVGWIGFDKYTHSFWIGYSFITLSFIGQLICTAKTLETDSATKTFYNISLISASYGGLISSFVVGGLCMLISPLPYWAGAIICTCILVLNIIAVAKADFVIAEIERVDEKVKTQTIFIKSLTVDAEKLVNRSKSKEIKIACKKVYEAARYSIKMSDPKLSSLESKIITEFSRLSAAAEAEDISSVERFSNEVIVLLEQRNSECKLLKR